MNQFQVDLSWQKQYEPTYSQIIGKSLSKLTQIRVMPASEMQDMKMACDVTFTIRSLSQTLGCRMRRSNVIPTDLTLRAWRSSGVTTELEKIKSGCGDFYFYGWALHDQRQQIRTWMIIDLAKLRHSGLLDDLEAIPNKDHTTSFVALRFHELHDCIFDANIPAKIPISNSNPLYCKLCRGTGIARSDGYICPGCKGTGIYFYVS